MHQSKGLIDEEFDSMKLEIIIDENKKEEFSKFGEVIDYSFKKKGKSSHYYGYIKMKNKNEAKNAIDDISKNFKWKISMNEKIEKKQEPKKKV